MRVTGVWNRIRRAPSIGETLDAHNGYARGSDLVRLIVSSTVLIAHSMLLTGADIWTTFNAPYPQIISTVLLIFFSLSGFFVTASLRRNRGVGAFLALRGLRLFPALGFEVAVTALIIGPIVTTLTLGAYVSSPDFWSYFGNVIGDIHFNLPGVFEANVFRAVNASLWTIPLELMCLVSLAGLSLWRLDRSTTVLITCVGGLLLICLVVDQVDVLRAHFAVGPHSQIAVASAFFMGVLIYDQRYAIPVSRTVMVLCLCVATALSAIPGWRILAIPMLGYVTVCLTLIDMKPPRVFRSGEYSYGIYIYGFPVQQLVYHFFPLPGNWIANALVSWPITVCIAVVSFQLVERHALNLRRFVLAPRPNSPEPSGHFSWRKAAISVAMIVYFLLLMQWSDLFGTPGVSFFQIVAMAAAFTIVLAYLASRTGRGA